MNRKAESRAPPSLRRQKWLNDPALQKLLAMLNSAGEARVAGGAVRNALLKTAIDDVDVATTLPPATVIQLAGQQGVSARPTGVAHGTITVTVDGRSFEVTTLRVDAETFGRHARVRFTDDWQADAMRRDFTINALYCDAGGRVYDPVGGYPDLERRRVRFVGDPRQRILEDHLRILRFFRLHARYGRGRPDAEALEQCARLRKLIGKLSAERVRGELFKLLMAPAAPAVVRAMMEAGVLQVVLGARLGFDSFRRMAEIDAAHHLTPDALLRLECLTGRAEAFADRLRLTGAELARLKALRGTMSPNPGMRPRERRIVRYQLGRQTFGDAVRLGWARTEHRGQDRKWSQLLRFGAAREEREFPVRGEDLIALGFVPGPALGQALRVLEDWWLAKGFPERQVVLARADALGMGRQSGRAADD